MSRLALAAFLTASLALAVYGFTRDTASESLDEYLDVVKRRPSPPLEPIPSIDSPVPSLAYGRDPFQPLLTASAIEATAAPTSASGDATHSLASIDPSTLRLDRSYWEIEEPAAIVITGNGEQYRLMLGDPVGQAVVVEIAAGKIKLVDAKGRFVQIQ